VFFWIFDRVVHVIFQSAIWCNKAGIGEEKLSEYRKKDGRFKFQIDLGNALISYALHEEWSNQEGPHPSWNRMKPFIPCDCGVCYFYENGLTSGIVHKHEKEAAKVTHVHHKDNSTTVVKGHTSFCADLQRGNQRCRQCYHVIKQTEEEKTMTSEQIKG
jgi:hypothetical protein